MARRARILNRMRRRQTQRAQEISGSTNRLPEPRSHLPLSSPPNDSAYGGVPLSFGQGDLQMPSSQSLTIRQANIARINEDLRRAEAGLQRMRQRAEAMSSRGIHPDVRREASRIRHRISNANDNAIQEYSGEAEYNRQRAKRRKLDRDAMDGGFKGFSYGYRGQAVSGPLKMEMMSCDGGLLTDTRGSIKEYCPENILCNDQTVYCSKADKCNIILRHQGETAFALNKIIIKAPERGFDAPIQEGLIFVAMDVRDLQNRTSAYQIRELSPSVSPESESEDEEILASTRRIISNVTGNRPPSRRADIGTPRVIPPPISSLPPLSIPPSSPIIHSNAVDGAPSPPPFTVTTHCNDPSSDEEEESTATTLADRNLRNLLTPSSSDSEDLSTEFPSRHTSNNRRRTRRRSLPSCIEIVPSHDRPTDPSEISNNNDDPPILAPHARFFIERESSTVTVRFQPEVYVLSPFPLSIRGQISSQY